MPKKPMSYQSRKEYLASIYKHYRLSSRKEKRKILDEFARATGYQRKYAIRLLNAPLKLTPLVRKGKGETYTNNDVYYLKKVWDILDYPCGQRLKPMMPEIMEVLERNGEISFPKEVKDHLLKISDATIDRRLRFFKSKIRNRIHGTTKPGSLLKKQIPITLSRWNERRPGFTELDLVAHCGMSAYGDFVATLNITDLATGWTEEAAILGKAQKRVVEALNTIRKRFPFELKGIDPDNGSEFINWQLYTYCLKKKIDFTRGRPNKKNDNAHIEQKNWSHVRKLVGYERLTIQEEADLLNCLYQGPLRVYMNFFQPAMKLMKKERLGGHLKRTYDIPKTPYRRVLECSEIPKVKKQELTAFYQTLNPVILKREIETLLTTLHQLVRKQKQSYFPVTFPMTERISEKLHFQMI